MTIRAMGTFLLALLLGAVAVVYVGVHYPSAGLMMLGGAHQVKAVLTSAGLGPQYKFWVEFLLNDNQLMFLSFTVIARMLIAIAGGTLAAAGRAAGRSARSLFPPYVRTERS
ncbi:MAG: hypothetical protein ACREC6_01865 [Hyphomicrobiaceae bacterium]